MIGWEREGLLRDREEAGRLLAERLGAYRERAGALILALPRGGVAVGYAMSLALRLPLDVLIVRKLGAPGNPEYAIGAVAENGSVYLNPEAPVVLREFGVGREYIDRAERQQQGEIARRRTLYRHGRPLPDVHGREVLLVDDGIATGATFKAALEALRHQGARRVVAAIPVGPAETIRALRGQVDELTVLFTPEPFFAVGNHYEEFSQVGDEAVLAYLAGAFHPPTEETAGSRPA